MVFSCLFEAGAPFCYKQVRGYRFEVRGFLKSVIRAKRLCLAQRAQPDLKAPQGATSSLKAPKERAIWQIKEIITKF